MSRLAAQLGGQIATNGALTSIKLNADGTYTLKLDGKTLRADHVELALPFSILRSSVDWSKAGFNSYKSTAIREQGMGTNSKLHVQFTSRFWR